MKWGRESDGEREGGGESDGEREGEGWERVTERERERDGRE